MSAVEDSPSACSESLVTAVADVAFFLMAVDADVAAFVLSSIRTVQIGAELNRGVHYPLPPVESFPTENIGFYPLPLQFCLLHVLLGCYLMHKARPKTASKKPAFRALMVGIAFILVNTWVYLKWACVSLKRRGGRLVFASCFPFEEALSFLQKAIQQKYGFVETITIPLARSP